MENIHPNQKDLLERTKFGKLSRRHVSRLGDPEGAPYQYGWVVGVSDRLKPFDKIKPLALEGKSKKYKALFLSGHRVGFGDRFVPWEEMVDIQ